jgi:hypothetical protein
MNHSFRGVQNVVLIFFYLLVNRRKPHLVDQQCLDEMQNCG